MFQRRSVTLITRIIYCDTQPCGGVASPPQPSIFLKDKQQADMSFTGVTSPTTGHWFFPHEDCLPLAGDATPVRKSPSLPLPQVELHLRLLGFFFSLSLSVCFCFYFPVFCFLFIPREFPTFFLSIFDGKTNMTKFRLSTLI